MKLFKKDKIFVYIIIVLIGGYYGIIPLLGIKVWDRFEGWTIFSSEHALVNIFIGLGMFVYTVYKNK